MALRALLFDVDGTLADTERDGHRKAYNRAFRKLGLPFRWGPGLYRSLLRQPGGKERIGYYLERYTPELGAQAPAVASDRKSWIEAVHALKSRYFRNMVQKGQVPLRPGVARLMREAEARGLKIAIVSNASRASLEPLLQYSVGAELAAHLDIVVSGEDGARKKPAPDLYLVALKQLGVRAEECIAIEDSAMGLEAATAAGVSTIITLTGDTADQDFSDAVLVLDCLGEPGAPARCLRGDLAGADHITIDELERLAERRTAHAA